MAQLTSQPDSPDELQAVHDTVAGLRSEYGHAQSALARQFDELEQFRLDVLRQAELLDHERQAMARREHEVACQREAIERLVQLLEENALRTGSPGDADPELAAAALRERQALQEQLRRAEAELARRTDDDQQLSKTCAELAASRGELADAQAELAAARGDLESLQRERETLLSELELVRGRAAELYETVNDQKRELAELRNWAGEELRSLRAWCERQAVVDSRAIEGTAHEEPAKAAPPTPQSARPQQDAVVPRRAERDQAVALSPNVDRAQADPVLNSVMAQFARLQQDASHRRQARR